MKLLVIEDEGELAGLLHRGMVGEGHTVTLAPDGRSGLSLARHGNFDFILLDLNLPDIQGFEITETLRSEDVQTPIIMITARDDVNDRIAGLRKGADDYLIKPFAFEELLARMDAVLRRSRPASPRATPELAEYLSYGGVTLDYATKKVTIHDEQVRLTVKELEVLRMLLANPSRIHSRHEILRLVWGLEEDPLTNIVEVYISRLRRKLIGSGIECIDNVRGFGYRFDVVG